ncbi:hypothetical protein HMPREF9441_02641 [Paraprevotella clara YIT 11840]|uniref:Uncharacterized protein n=1 Tax=Paraprevotella clara YIT 11840 TaxID=762968 RepID=G5STD8_9BACT|nr:hypothetical protein HMPREF9441_02641 [Paraprevotella clara YIT 11840]
MDIHSKFSKTCFILQEAFQASGIQQVMVKDVLIHPSAFFQRQSSTTDIFIPLSGEYPVNPIDEESSP